MTREERRQLRRQLRIQWKMDPHGMGKRAEEAALKPDSGFLIELGEALKLLDPTVDSEPEIQLFHEQVWVALGKLLLKHGPKGIRAWMVYDAVNPKCSAQQYSEAFRKIGVRFSKAGMEIVKEKESEKAGVRIVKKKKS